MSQPSSVEVRVYTDWDSRTIRVGTAHISNRRGTVSTNFEYDRNYLRTPGAWAISPDLPLESQGGVTAGLPGGLLDSAPDRWGRNLIDKRLRATADPGTRTTRTPSESDYLLGVSDITRQGALRYSLDGTNFLASELSVPKLIELPKLLDAANLVSKDEASTDLMAAIKLLLDAGSGSLGGARPKASVRDGKLLKIAKFPHSSDAWDVMAWEKTALDLAERAHIQCPTRELVKVSSQNVLLLDRFDRGGDNRIPYLSAMSLMQVKDGSHSDYVELAEALAQHSSRAHNDLQELWRRIAFSIAINNTDDHMRNHGFLREPSGWLLSPIFDINPDPDSNKQRVTGINYITEPTQCQDALNSASEYFGITNEDAASIWSEIREALSECRTVERHS